MDREQLRKKLAAKKKKARNPNKQQMGDNPFGQSFSEDSIADMITQVNKMLKSNPDMIKQVSKCVNGIFENKDIIESIANNIQDQTLQSSSEGDLPTAESNESKQ